MNNQSISIPCIVLDHCYSPLLYQAQYRYYHDGRYRFSGFTTSFSDLGENFRQHINEEILSQENNTRLMLFICAEMHLDVLKNIVLDNEIKIEEIWCIAISSDECKGVVLLDSSQRTNTLIRCVSIQADYLPGFIYQFHLLNSKLGTHIEFCTQTVLDAISSRYLMCSSEYILQSNNTMEIGNLILNDKEFSNYLSKSKWVFLRISASNLTLGVFQEINDTVNKLLTDDILLNTSHVESSLIQNDIVHIEIIIFTSKC